MSDKAVAWSPELCVHCENCIQDLPSVFNLEARPWVDTSGATEDEITKQVKDCPTGALNICDIPS